MRFSLLIAFVSALGLLGILGFARVPAETAPAFASATTVGCPESDANEAGHVTASGDEGGSDEDAPPKFSNRFYRRWFWMNASADGFEGSDDGGDESPDGGDESPDGGDQTPDGGDQSPDSGDESPDDGEATTNSLDAPELPVSIEAVCRLPRRLKKQGKQLIGGDGVAVVSSRTHIVKDGRELTGASRLAELEGADTVSLKVRVFRPKHWRKDEDGNKIATFRARRIVITD